MATNDPLNQQPENSEPKLEGEAPPSPPSSTAVASAPPPPTAEEENANLLQELPVGVAEEVESEKENANLLQELPIGMAEEAEEDGPKLSISEEAEPGLDVTQTEGPKVSVDQTEGPKVSIEQNEGPKVSIDQAQGPSISISTDAPKTTIAARPKPTTLKADDDDHELKSKMAEVKAPVGEKEVFERMFEMLFGAMQATLGVAAGIVGGALKLATGGKLGDGLLGLAQHALKEHPIAQEYADRFVKVPKPKPEANPEADEPEPDPKKSVPTRGEMEQLEDELGADPNDVDLELDSEDLSGRLQAVGGKLADLQKQNPAIDDEHLMTTAFEQAKAGAGNIADLTAQLDADNTAKAKVQQAPEPDANTGTKLKLK